MYDCSFEEILLEAVDEALTRLGDSPKQAVYYQLEKKFGLKRQEIPRKITEFERALDETFGLGARLLKIRITKCLYERIGPFKYFPEGDDLEFSRYVGAARVLWRKVRSPKELQITI